MMALILTLMVSVVFASDTPALRVDEVSARQGEQITVRVTLTGNPGLQYLRIWLQYDSKALELTSADRGVIMTGGLFNEMRLGEGIHELTFYDFQSSSDNGVLAMFTFRIPEDAPVGTAQLTIQVMGSSADETFEIQNGGVTIEEDTSRHNWSAVQYTWSADLASCTASRSCDCCGTQTANATVTTSRERATCTEDGMTVYTATFAEKWASADTKTVIEPALGHMLRKIEITQSSCPANGSGTYYACTACGKFFLDGEGNEELKEFPGIPDENGHIYEEPVYSWSDDGKACTAYRVCACGHTETAEAKVTVRTKDPTCTEEGYVRCVAQFNVLWATPQTLQSQTIPANGHRYGEVLYSWSVDYGVCKASRQCACGYKETAYATVSKVTDEPTCTTAGRTVCTAAFDVEWASTQSKELPGEEPLGEHRTVTDEAKPATCTADGLTEGSHCSSCGEVLRKQEVIPAKGHQFGEVSYSWALDRSGCTASRACQCGFKESAVATVNTQVIKATCKEGGSTTYTASFTATWARSQQLKQDGLAALGHRWNQGKTIKATCEEDGYTLYTCTLCGETKTETDAGSALSHDWDEGVLTAPTCLEDGYYTYTCSNCGTTKTEEDEGTATGHTAGKPEISHVVEATCNKEGSHLEVTSCTCCGAEMEQKTVILPALDHADEDADGNCDSCGTHLTEADPAPIRILTILGIILIVLLLAAVALVIIMKKRK